MLNHNGVVILESQFSVDVTVDRLVNLLQNKGATIYAVINQQEELSKSESMIPPMQLVLFGNPSAGGKIIAESPAAGLDLPLKALIWEDNHGIVRAAFNAPDYLAERYGLSSRAKAILDIEPLIAAASRDR